MLIVKSNIETSDSKAVNKYRHEPTLYQKPTLESTAEILTVDLTQHYLLIRLIDESQLGFIEAMFLTDKSVNQEYQSIIRQARALRKNGNVDIKALLDYDYRVICQYDGDFDSFQVVDIQVIQDSYEKNISEATKERNQENTEENYYDEEIL